MEDGMKLERVSREAAETDREEGGRDTRLPIHLVTPVFCPPNSNPMIFQDCSRDTYSDVLATTTTWRPCNDAIPHPSKSIFMSLPTKDSMRAVKVPRKRLHKKLIKERDKFMRKLQKEREGRQQIENWAARKIQSTFRSFCTRPKKVTYKAKSHHKATVATIRKDLMNMRQKIDESNPAIRQYVPAWRESVQLRARGTREARSLKDQIHIAATIIQAMVRGYIARIGQHYRRARQADDFYRMSIVRVQRVYRGYLDRIQVSTEKQNKRDAAAIAIQAAVRGALGREIVGLIKLEKMKNGNEKDAACTLQTLFRGRRERLQYQKQKANATKIQKIARGRIARSKKTGQKSDAASVHPLRRQESPDESVKRVMSVSTIHFTPLDMEPTLSPTNEAEAIVKIQSLARGDLTRRSFRAKKTKDNASATKIQALHRGNITRKKSYQIRD